MDDNKRGVVTVGLTIATLAAIAIAARYDNNYSVRTPEISASSHVTGLLGKEEYARHSDGSEEVFIVSGGVTSPLLTTLYTNLGGHTTVDRIRTERGMKIENILVRSVDGMTHISDFLKADSILAAQREKYQ